MFGETFNDLNRSFRERTRGGLVDLERGWRDFLRGLSGNILPEVAGEPPRLARG
jgi:hypothetical protein